MRSKYVSKFIGITLNTCFLILAILLFPVFLGVITVLFFFGCLVFVFRKRIIKELIKRIKN